MALGIKVDVTQGDIDSGKQNRCEECPLALAITRATGKTASVTAFNVHIQHRGFIRSVRLPDSAFVFRSDFDLMGRKHVKPFTFYLDRE